MSVRIAVIAVFAALVLAPAVLMPRGAGAALPVSLSGVVESGGTAGVRPLGGVKVTLYEARTASPRVLDEATTDRAGRFALFAPTNESGGVFYLAAHVGRGVKLVAVLGQRLPRTATINELTTVAAGYSMAQFTDADGISGDGFALQIAAGMNDNLVDTMTGASSRVLRSSPNADQTNSLRSTRSLANLLAACIKSRRVTARFLALTKPFTGPPPATTFQALANLARNPGRHVARIYRLTKRSGAFAPALESRPDAWTVVVKVNDSGSDEQDKLIGGPGNLAFDGRGYAWVTNNVVQGTTGSSSVVVVLQPDGRAADGTNGTPSSPLGGGGILGTGYGVTIGGDGSAWFGNFGWGGVIPTPGVDGSVSRFAASGAPLSGPNGYVGDPYRVQGMATDADGNVWMASFGDNSVYVFPDGDPSRAVRFHEYPGSQPFDVAIAPDGTAWVSNGLLGTSPGSVANFAFVHGRLELRTLRFVGRALKGIAVDSRGNAWVASLDDNAVYGIRPDGSLLGSFAGGGIYGPWGVTIDGDDNLWVANFGPIEANNTLAAGRLSKLCGVNRAACPPGKRLGDPISPATGFTVPSAGSQVLLHNGEPLYGKHAPPSYIPMMRQTASAIDRAGNVWTINNYKPNFDVDATVNPGGDGILVFVGLAPPARVSPGTGFGQPYAGTPKYEKYAPTEASTASEVNRPLGQKRADRIARKLGLNKRKVFTARQYRLFVSGRGVRGRRIPAKLVDESVRILTNTTGRPLYVKINNKLTPIVLSSYGLFVNKSGMLESPANTDAPTRKVNRVITPGGYLGRWCTRNGCRDSLRMLYRSAYTSEVVYGHQSQQQSGVAQLVPNQKGERSSTVGMSMAPSIWIVNFALIYTLKPKLAAAMPARWTPIPTNVVQALEASPTGQVPFSQYESSFPGCCRPPS